MTFPGSETMAVLSEGASMGTTVEFGYVWGWEGSAGTFPRDLLDNLHV